MGPSSERTQGGSPLEVYTRRREDRQRRAARLGRRERLVGNARVGLFLGGLALLWLVLGPGAVSGWWLLLPAGAFSALLVWHERLTRAWYRARQAVAFYDAGLARLGDGWKGTGQAGARFLDENHPYAADLDLFGPASLFELLCTARTRTGADTLAGWLLRPAGPDEIRARQAAVVELKPQLDLRAALALLGGGLPAGVDF